MASKLKSYPRYRVSQWLDTSDDAMSKPQATIYYGVQIKTDEDARWAHCHRNGEPLLYATAELASTAIDQMRSR